MGIQILTTENIPMYLSQQPALLNHIGEIASIELSDQGKINGVFFVHGFSGSLVLKQGLPWVRVLPDWPLPASRVAGEARLLTRWSSIDNGCTPVVFNLDDKHMVLAMEYLGDHVLLRDLLSSETPISAVGDALGRTLGKVALATSPLAGSSEDYREDLIANQNSVLSKLMEDVVFTTPFSDSDSNVSLPVVKSLRNELIGSPEVMAAVAQMHWIFTTRHEALIHGDLHSGSILVLGDDVRVIDAEFGRYGPIAWDLGEFWAHVAIAAMVHEGRGNMSRAAHVSQLVRRSWGAFRSAVVGTMHELTPERTVDWWLRDIQHQAVRFSGVEALRRVIGIGECEQLLALEGETKDSVTKQVVRQARRALVDSVPMVSTEQQS